MKVTLIARVKDNTVASGYRLRRMIIRKGRPVPLPDCTSFYLRYTAKGRRVVKPAGNDLELAFIAWENHSRNLPALQRGESITGVAQELLADFKENAGGISLGEAAQTYMQQLEGKALSTIGSYRFAVNEFVKFAGANTPVSKIDRNVLIDYRGWLFKRKMNENTLCQRLVKVSMLLKSFGVEKLLRTNDYPKVNERVPESYSRDEIERLLAASTPEERLLWEFFLYSGARNAEVQHVVKGDIRLIKNAGGTEVAVLTIRSKPELNWRTKSRKDRTVRLPLDYAKRLLEARAGIADDSLLFPNSERGPNKHYDVILNRVAKKAGLGGRIDCHKFRATTATRLHANGMSVQDVQRMLGHRDIKTTLRYLSSAAPESEVVGKAVEAAFGS